MACDVSFQLSLTLQGIGQNESESPYYYPNYDDHFSDFDHCNPDEDDVIVLVVSGLPLF